MQDLLVVSLKKESFSSPSNVILSLDHALFSEQWSFEESFEQKDIEIVLSGSSLKKGTNDFVVTVSYEDNEGKVISESQEVTTELVGLTFGESTNVFLNSINGKISKFITETIYHATTPDEKETVKDHINILTIVLISLAAVLFLTRIIKSFAHR